MIKEIKKNLPQLKSELKEELMKNGLNEEYANILINENKIEQFKELGSGELAAKLLVLYPKEIASHEKIDLEKVNEKLNLAVLKDIISAVKGEKIAESSVKSVLTEITKGHNLTDLLKKFKPSSKSEIEKEVKSAIKEKPGLTAGAYMGLLMQKLKGRVEGKELMQMIQKAMK